jgi:cellulose synthase/poly-beta-1,6-N-acetylglucosamine synthase-like glycosyltransferase
VAVTFDYASFSTLSGPLGRPADDVPHRVAYRRVLAGRELWRVLPLLVGTLCLSSLFFVWLVLPRHYPGGEFLPRRVRIGNAIMFWLIVTTEGIRLVNSITLCWSAFIMRNPVPVTPPDGGRVAFTTTIVPSKEPLGVVRETLRAAREIRWGSPVDVWLLDEGDEPAVRAMCAELGVRHFSRKGVAEWNTTSGPFRARTKHGNHNSWLDAHGDEYDIVLSVDPDHVPLANFADRMLGYFRDPDVAFVVGPQVYGNVDHYLTRAAEAQNYMFHSVIQRAANAFGAGMFVGTNHAYRVATWRQVGGFQDSITEDLATSFAVHGARNPATGEHWRSVYTPDVVAVGEGPATWTDLFNQQLRWARGANEVMVTQGPRRLRALGWGRRAHYLTLMLHYPTAAITWMLGVALTVLYMVLGTTGVTVRIGPWLALYIDVLVARLLLYVWLRRFTISPHESRDSSGLSGILISILCTPFYSSALVGALSRRKLGFVVTPKGEQVSPDRLMTFRKHLFWAAISAASIIAAVALGHIYPANLVWAGMSLLTCLLPVGLWAVERMSQRRTSPRRTSPRQRMSQRHEPRRDDGPRPAAGRPAAVRRGRARHGLARHGVVHPVERATWTWRRRPPARGGRAASTATARSRTARATTARATTARTATVRTATVRTATARPTTARPTPARASFTPAGLEVLWIAPAAAGTDPRPGTGWADVAPARAPRRGPASAPPPGPVYGEYETVPCRRRVHARHAEDTLEEHV